MGPGNAEALGLVTAKLQQQGAMFDRFHSFGDDLEVEGGSQAKYTFKNGQVIRVVEHIAHKTLVYLEHTDG
jgi:hypothetical protein